MSTVSRALNDYPDVSQETKQRILKIVETYHYRPNGNAKNLKQSSTNNVNIVVKGRGNPFFEGIVEQMQSRLARKGLHALVTYIDERSDEIEEAVRLCHEKKPEGIIFLGGVASRYAESLRNFTVPCVVSTVYVPFQEDDVHGCVCVNDEEAAGSAVEYLIRRGHRQIAILGGQLGNADGIERRYNGAVRVMREHGIAFDAAYYRASKFSLKDAYQGTQDLLDSGAPFTALFAMSDVMAIGAAKAIIDSGRRVPEDISVIGFDGIAMSRFYNPSLATVQQPSREVADASVDLLVCKIKGEKAERNVIFLPTRLIEGASVRRLAP